ncbi:MAG TPA: lipid-A-disaccharide synthase [Woeseiaceae bacterium]|nr:lipid-A-disaccharide synthase [Woeseiaceae bacterium]
MSLRIGLVAGEASGDQLGGGLVRELKRLRPDVECEGVAGPMMAAAGCSVLADSSALAVMGLVEPLREIPRLLKLRRELVRRWSGTRPQVFVGIDSPDFNLGLEIALKRAGIRTVQYVSPSVWAWRQRRIAKIARAVDRVLCLLPFEKAFYDAHGVPADFVGHPLADRLEPGPPDARLRESLGLSSSCIVAVLPGSRSSEVARLGPVFAEACRRLLERRPDTGFVAPMASAALRELFAGMLEQAGVAAHFRLQDGNAHAAMRAADVVLLASGTAALEAALLGRPIVAAYRLAPLTYALARSLKLVKVRHFTLPNLLTEEPMVPEFLQGGANAQALSESLEALLGAPGRRAEIAREFAKLRDQLARGADRLAAQAVLELAVPE